MDKAKVLFIRRIIFDGGLLEKEHFLDLSDREKVEYINFVALYRNSCKAVIIDDNHYYDADDNEEITNLVEYAENLHDYGYKLFD